MEGLNDHESFYTTSSKEGLSFKIYLCKYCGRDFLNPQALGGHQNAHRIERREVRLHKQAKVFSLMMANFGLSMMPYHFIQPHGVELNQNSVAEGSSFISSPSHSHWLGSYRLGDGAQNCNDPASIITKHVMNKARVEDGGADQELLVEDGGAPAQPGLRLELPDLNLDYAPI
ncbi:zinc finger protein 7-like [Chenopodium quinoa]|uniref:C2H2-type domain-containing protein n=1 Tax=Chenopodium quinoa TaxID=63459 RepID=A0A803KSA0_CHEQI|nr:zinc finger protein 7-like [Chenopodium quinoa]